MPAEKLLFIDTNIWLDFYRARNDTGLKLLKHVEALSDKLIVTYQLESEFKRNRQNVLMDSWENLKPPNDLGFPNIMFLISQIFGFGEYQMARSRQSLGMGL